VSAGLRSKAADDFFPGYARAINTVGKERGWGPMTGAQFEAQLETRRLQPTRDYENVMTLRPGQAMLPPL